MARSALLNVMVNAAIKAGRALTRDFGEVENLQVSRKGPADLVCMIEVRPSRRGPVVVRRHAATKDGGVTAAVDGMRTVLGRLFGRSDERHPGADTIRGRAG